VCNLEENLVFFTLILGSVVSDYVVFYGDYIYPRDAMLVRYLLSSCVGPSVCLSVRLSQVLVLLRRLNLGSGLMRPNRACLMRPNEAYA